MWPNPQETADLVTFPEEFLNEKLHFSVQWKSIESQWKSEICENVVSIHCRKYRNFTWLHGVEISWKGTVSTKFRAVRKKSKQNKQCQRHSFKACNINIFLRLLSQIFFFFFDFIFDINRSFLSLHYVVICQLQPVVKINGGNFNYRIITWEKLMTLLVFITWNYSVD